MNGESTVISFEKLQSRQRDAAKHSPSRLFVQGRAMLIDGVAERLAGFFAKVDDELFNLSEKADNCVLQAYYFNTMRYLRCQKDAVQAHYLRELTGFYEAFWHGKPLPALLQTPAIRSELSLLENEILEERLAINGMVEKGNGLFQKELCALDRRFMALLGKPEQAIEINPVSPLALCRLFASAVSGLSLEINLKLMIYKIFDKQVLSSFGSVYHEMNAYMIKAGICPASAKGGQARRPRTEEASSARRHKKEEGDAKVANADAFEAMRHLLQARRGRLDATGQSASPQGGTAVIDSAEVLNALGLLPPAFRASAENGGLLSSEQMKQLIAQQIGGLRADGKEPLLDRRVEDVIDMVGMIFVYILQDRHLPASIKAMLANLQIPVLKIALLEESFFAKKNHPARLLLNSLAQAAMGLDGGMEADSPVYQKIEAVVGRILAEWNRNSSLFYELLEDFTAFMAIEYRRNRAAEERTRQATQSKEQVRQAKKAVAYVIASKLQGVNPPWILKSFLCSAWKDVLVLAWLRRKRDREDWSSAVGLMDQLIKDITSAHAPEFSSPQAPGDGLLLETMKSRLENLAYDQYWIMALLRELEVCYAAHVHGVHVQPEVAVARKHDEVGVKDPDFAAFFVEIEDNLRKGGNSRGGRGVLARDQAAAGLYRGGGEDEFVSKACSLGVGQWVEFTEGQCKPRRAKLSWKSRESDVHIFVNAKGAKVVEMSLADLVGCFRVGAAKIIEDSSVPLMDRALSRLMQALENPACACVP